MTKEQILDGARWINHFGRERKVLLQCMQDFADQELAKERERYDELKAKYDSVVMDNMAHEFNQAEAERFAPEYERQIREEERERAGKLVEACKTIMSCWSERMNQEIEVKKESSFGGYWSPVASLVDSYAINGLRKALTEYEKSKI